MPALTADMCPGSGTNAFDPVPCTWGGYFESIGYCGRCGRLVYLTLSAKLYRHNTSGRDSSWVKWIKRELERA